MRISKVIDDILMTSTPLKRKNTRTLHDFYLNKIKRDIGKKSLTGFKRKQFTAYISKLRSEGPRKTFNDYVKFINIIYNYAYRERMIPFLVRFPKVDSSEKTGRVYSSDEILRIWEALGPSMRLQFLMSFEMFMRLREVINLTWERVDLKNQTIILRKEDVKTGSRTGKGRNVPISKNVLIELFALKENSKTPWVFPNSHGTSFIESNKKAWSVAKRRANITGKARWHDLRHTALTLAINVHGIAPAKLCQVAGLSMRTLEKVYLHEQVEHLREVMDQIDIKKIA